MTNPPEPGTPHHPAGPGPGRPGGPESYGPPPPRPAATGPGTGPRPGPAPNPGPGPGPGQPPPAWVPQPRPTEGTRPAKGFLGALLDTDFEHLITPRLIKLFYTLSLMLITLSALIVLAFGIWVFKYGWLLALMAFIFAPLMWLFEIVLVRIFMEAVIVRFKSVDHLRAIKDRGMGRP
ncbi:DUF4282 domain-containing protein [Actinomadura alba]|uniref:DUF4282 domain-containing protein n=1 Tax=Actinomadura alba TaxID=406431 RepID=A0ABR7LQF2_9ACTN|nr:DUF4282 domain-containing protein [Actinomadura alba]MBC6467077.1 DUF4282 domain-containing protein [Actinomadura alba]